MRTRLAQIAALTMGLGFAMPAAAETAAEIDKGVQEAMSACRTSVPGCDVAEKEADGILVFPGITKGAIGVGGSYGEGALLVGDKTEGYYNSASASIGFQLGAEKYTQLIMFMTKPALDAFTATSGWEVGVNAKVTMIDTGDSAGITSIIAENDVLGFLYGQKGLMGDFSIQGAKITKIDR
jgi:lipid-binding SYLF domain-containing protein